MNKARQSKKKKKTSVKPETKKPPDVTFYGYSEVLEAENKYLFSLTMENIDKFNFVQKIKQEIKLNNAEINGIAFHHKFKSKWDRFDSNKIKEKRAELNAEISLLQKNKPIYRTEFMIKSIDDFINEKKRFLDGLDLKGKGGTAFNTADDLNFYIYEKIYARALKNLESKGL